jgi:hypothetical protein
MDSDRSKLSEKLKHWLTAMANVFYNGDEDAAWKDVIKNAEEDELRWEKEKTVRPSKARVHLKIRN